MADIQNSNRQGQQNGNQENSENKKGTKSNRGFASMSEDQQREIASKGGRTAHQQGVAHEWTSEQAREAGRKGGQASQVNRKQSANNTNGTENNTRNPDTQETSSNKDILRDSRNQAEADWENDNS